MRLADYRDRVEELEGVLEKVSDELQALREDIGAVLGEENAGPNEDVAQGDRHS
jgi:hypothetical protein